MGTIRVGRSDVPLYDRVPDGWKRTKGAQTAPIGYVWVDNNKSMFGGERKSGMVPESAVRPDMGQYRQEAQTLPPRLIWPVRRRRSTTPMVPTP